MQLLQSLARAGGRAPALFHPSSAVASLLRQMALAVLVLLAVLTMAPSSLGAADAATLSILTKPRSRVIIDNDFGGDPDGLFALAQHLLCRSVEVRAVIGSHNYPNGFYGHPGTSAHAVEVANELLTAIGPMGRVPVFTGASRPLGDDPSGEVSEAARFIVKEAMRDDTKAPLYVVCGAGLTDLARAYLLEPRIADRLTLIWIGGPEYPGVAVPPPGKVRVEYNLGIDVQAAQVIFNRSPMPVWQVPRDTYRQALVSFGELDRRISDRGRLGAFLLNRLRDLLNRANLSLGETYVLGDSPLVLLTALQTGWEADPASSRYASLPAPIISDEGWYRPNPQGRLIRVYTMIDTRLMFEDLYAKIAEFDFPAHAGDHPGE